MPDQKNMTTAQYSESQQSLKIKTNQNAKLEKSFSRDTHKKNIKTIIYNSEHYNEIRIWII